MLIWALLAPFLLLALMPSAVMPARTADGTMTLVLCTTEGQREIAISLVDGRPVEREPGKSLERCDWSAPCAAAVVFDRTSAPSRMASFTRAPVAEPSAAPKRLAAAFVRPPATGPPAA